jgi:hypothetical protein
MPERLTPALIRAAAARHSLNPASLQAIISVESSGSGYLGNGWVRILYERHWLWRRLEERGIIPTKLAAERPDLCGRSWDRRYYRGGAAEWDRVAAVQAWGARADPERWESYKKAAYESCSWGLFQLMGFHYTAAGYANIYELKHAFEESEVEQLDAILRWMSGNGLLAKLRAQDWTGFARGYNGNGQVPYYSSRLLQAYRAARLMVAYRVAGGG